MIISGGENVYPAIIEKVLSQCPDLSEVAVIGRPDDYWGEVVVAVIVPSGEMRDAERILNFCEGRIAPFAMPREVIFVDRLPRNAMGKVVKEMLHETVLAVTAQT
jgi:fatty-acyl-CoA synthase